MKATLLLLLFLPAFVKAQVSDFDPIGDVGERIEFQEMRGDTMVVRGSVTGNTYGKRILYRWVLFEGEEVIGTYGAPPETPYLLATIEPGDYYLVRMTDHYMVDPKVGYYQTVTTKSNTIQIRYVQPTIKYYSERE